jgi:hypothetical protein
MQQRGMTHEKTRTRQPPPTPACDHAPRVTPSLVSLEARTPRATPKSLEAEKAYQKMIQNLQAYVACRL